jgi:hypothetical protein
MQVQENRMFKPLVNVAFAAALAGLFVFATTAMPNVTAPVTPPPQASVLAYPLPLQGAGTACSQHGWPNFEQRCQFDLRKRANDGRTVRVIALY